MRWRSGRRSTNIEDRRVGRRRVGIVSGGVGTVLLIVVGLYFGIDPALLIQGVETVSAPGSRDARPQPGDLRDDPLADMVSVVVADTEDVWTEIFAAGGLRYEEPTLVLFTGTTRSACGLGYSSMGPFYCPADMKAYIDLGFYDELRARFQAPGDFAQAYVIAHEIGHHVQNLLGVSEEVGRMRQRLDEAAANELSVRVELQADCYAGVWAHHADRARNILESGDLEEALTAASAIGDDTLQKQAQGTVVPETFTHGTSAQRQRWFRVGIQTGDPGQCDTFAAGVL